MSSEEILEKLKIGQINSELALEALSELGMCPNLLNDDNGRWALSFDGFQNIYDPDEPSDIMTTNFITADNWKESIYDAIVYSLEKDNDEGIDED